MSEDRILTAARVFVETVETVALEIDTEARDDEPDRRDLEIVFSRTALEELVRAVQDRR